MNVDRSDEPIFGLGALRFRKRGSSIHRLDAVVEQVGGGLKVGIDPGPDLVAKCQAAPPKLGILDCSYWLRMPTTSARWRSLTGDYAVHH